MWSYRARDVVATVAHGMWGSFWLAFGLLQIFILTGKIPAPVPGAANDALGLWFFGLAYMTGIAALAATFESLGIGASSGRSRSARASRPPAGSSPGSATAGSEPAASCSSSRPASPPTWCWRCRLTAMTKRTILPTGHFKKDRNIPGRQPLEAVELPWAEPGIKQGQ